MANFTVSDHYWIDKAGRLMRLLWRQAHAVRQFCTGQRCLAPGAWRHHWGTDLDIFDPDLLPAGARLQLTPEEYLPGGYFAPLTRWLDRHLADYGFFRPYAHDRGGVAVEPWHISYRPLADRAAQALTPAVLLQAWRGQEVAGSAWLAPQLAYLFRRYIDNIDKE